jgi:SAM-dependent methyltransferase
MASRYRLTMGDRLSEARGDAEAARSVSAAPVRRGWLRARVARLAAEPLAASQRAFNDAALQLIDALSERVDTVAGQAAGAERRSRELEERLLRLERRPTADGPRTVAAQPHQDALPDYFAFESRMRSPTAEVRERQRPYVELLRDSAPVLDLGCGRGELLRLLSEAGVAARGVDADADMVAFARGDGLDVAHSDACTYLEGVEDASLGAVVALQLVEHLPPAMLVTLLALAARKLRPGGMLVAETINPLAPQAIRNFFADLTHAQPLVPETLELLANSAGFEEIEIRYINPPPTRLREPALPPGGEWDAARSVLAENTRLVNDLLFAPLDYLLIARRPPTASSSSHL